MRNKYIRMLVVAILAAMILVACNQKEGEVNENVETGDQEVIIAKAESLISLLAEGEYEEAVKDFDEKMQKEAPPATLEELWDTLLHHGGSFIDQELDSIEPKDGGYQLVYIKGLFEATEVTFLVSFDKDEQIVGFFVDE